VTERLRRQWRERRLVRTALATMPPASWFWLALTVFALFSSIGFLGDVTRGGTRPFGRVLYEAAASGTIATVWVIVMLRRPRWFAVAVAVQLAYLLFGSRLPFGASGAPGSLSAEALSARLTLDANATLAAVMIAYVAFVTLIGREMRRFVSAHAEIALAREIHRGLVPPIAGVLDGFEFCGVSHASGDVGGDLVDFVARPDGTWVGYVADVSGHGVASGVLMGMTKSAARLALERDTPLPALLARLNRTLIGVKSPNMFVTACCIGFGPTGLRYALAGHLPVLVFRRATGMVEELRDGGIALGLVDDAGYEDRQFALGAGDVAALVTDGLTEVFDRHDREFGLNGVKGILAGHGRRSLAEIGARVLEAARAHGEQIDDQTFLLIRRTG
jgi:serine phosphatase RsbU (regulator of sigma subunit)